MTGRVDDPRTAEALARAWDPWVGVSDLEKAARVVERAGFGILADEGRVWGHGEAKRIAAALRALDAPRDILDAVAEALQPAEELGGTEDYLRLMRNVRAMVERRIDAYLGRK